MATTYYIDPILGDDTFNGTAKATPFATISKWNAMRVNGDTAILRKGRTHNDALMTVGTNDRVYGNTWGSGAPAVLGAVNGDHDAMVVNGATGWQVVCVSFVGTIGPGTPPTVDLVAIAGAVGTAGRFDYCTFTGGKNAIAINPNATGKVTVHGAQVYDQWVDGLSSNGTGGGFELDVRYADIARAGVGNTGDAGSGDGVTAHAAGRVTVRDSIIRSCRRTMFSILESGENVFDRCEFRIDDNATNGGGAIVQGYSSGTGTTTIRNSSIAITGSQLVRIGALYTNHTMKLHGVTIVSRNTNVSTCPLSVDSGGGLETKDVVVVLAGAANHHIIEQGVALGGTTSIFSETNNRYYPDSATRFKFNDTESAWATFGKAGAVSDATNASPIVLTVADNPYRVGDIVVVSGITGNTAANGTWLVQARDATHITLLGTTGNGAYVSGGTVVGTVSTGTAIADPLLENATTGTTMFDFRLKAGSPCIGAGVDLGAASDVDGFGRKRRTAYASGGVDIGATEYAPGDLTGITGSWDEPTGITGDMAMAKVNQVPAAAMHAGDDATVPIPLSNVTSDELTGAAGTFILKNGGVGGTLLLTKTDADGLYFSGTTAYVQLAAADTAGLGGSYYFEIEVTLATGKRKVVASGTQFPILQSAA